MKAKNPLTAGAITLPSWVKLEREGFAVSVVIEEAQAVSAALGYLLDLAGFTSQGRRVFFAISEKYTGSDSVTLTDFAGLPRSVFYAGVKDLAAKGLISVKQRESGEYWLNPGFMWEKAKAIKVGARFQTDTDTAGDAGNASGMTAQAMRLFLKIF